MGIKQIYIKLNKELDKYSKLTFKGQREINKSEECADYKQTHEGSWKANRQTGQTGQTDRQMGQAGRQAGR